MMVQAIPCQSQCQPMMPLPMPLAIADALSRSSVRGRSLATTD